MPHARHRSESGTTRIAWKIKCGSVACTTEIKGPVAIRSSENHKKYLFMCQVFRTEGQRILCSVVITRNFCLKKETIELHRATSDGNRGTIEVLSL